MSDGIDVDKIRDRFNEIYSSLNQEEIDVWISHDKNNNIIMDKDIKVSAEWAIEKGFKLGYSEEDYYTFRLSDNKFCDLSILMCRDEETNEWICTLFPYDDFVFRNVKEMEQLIKLLTKDK